jgi:hypothetical protein
MIMDRDRLLIVVALWDATVRSASSIGMHTFFPDAQCLAISFTSTTAGQYSMTSA